MEIEGADIYNALLSRWHAEGAELLDELRCISKSSEARITGVAADIPS
jgi:hypothetical protein